MSKIIRWTGEDWMGLWLVVMIGGGMFAFRELAIVPRATVGLCAAANAQILKAQGFHPRTIEQVLCIHHHGVADDPADAVKIQSAEFRPSRTQHQGVCAFSH